MSLDTIFRKVPSFKGKLRLAKRLISRNIVDAEIATKAGKFILPNVIDNQYFELYVNGSYERKVVDYIVNNIPTNGVFLDIGANIGAISIPVAIARPDITIIAIEAMPHIFSYFKRNLELNNIDNVRALNVCCADVEGRHIRFYHHEELFGNSSFHSLHTNKHIELVTTTIDVQLQSIQVKQVDVIKIDTEGSEGLIFKGGLNSLRNYKPKILFEFVASYEEAIEGLAIGASQQILKQLGYDIYHFEYYPHQHSLESTLMQGGFELIAIPGAE
jgi:FkbM family methyltransferase